MSSKTFKRFCKLSTYVKQKDAKFYDIFSDLCIEYVLRPVAGAKGVTLLFPEDPKYREEIITAAHSTDPNKAVDMIKAIIVKDFLPNPASFGSSVVNLLNQKIKVASFDDKGVELDNKLKLVIDKDFIPFGYRTNMAVYTIKGKGRIRIDGEVVKETSKPASASLKKMGGSAEYSSGSSTKKALQDFIAEKFCQEIGVVNNIYVKKVCLQLKYLSQDASIDKSKVVEFLGNDEFSDSYLLDMYCDAYFPNAFSTILTCLQTSMSEVNVKADKAKYIELKKSFASACKMSTSSDPSRLRNIKGPMDFRERVKTLYNDEERAAKDLFIVFCNINRDLWQTDSDAVNVFKNFAFLASNVYTECSGILSKEFDIARDLTLYGNLLKSDVFMFCPSQGLEAMAGKTSLAMPSSLPSPLDMQLYSLNWFINRPVNMVNGGNPEVGILLKDL